MKRLISWLGVCVSFSSMVEAGKIYIDNLEPRTLLKTGTLTAIYDSKIVGDSVTIYKDCITSPHSKTNHLIGYAYQVPYDPQNNLQTISVSTDKKGEDTYISFNTVDPLRYASQDFKEIAVQFELNNTDLKFSENNMTFSPSTIGSGRTIKLSSAEGSVKNEHTIMSALKKIKIQSQQSIIFKETICSAPTGLSLTFLESDLFISLTAHGRCHYFKTSDGLPSAIFPLITTGTLSASEINATFSGLGHHRFGALECVFSPSIIRDNSIERIESSLSKTTL